MSNTIAPLKPAFFVCGLLFYSVYCVQAIRAEGIIPSTGILAVHQRALEVASSITVAGFSLEPGYEDLSALAFLRLGKGARVINAILTNGEGGESDISFGYPNEIAATRRLEAARASAYLGIECHFFNFPHLPAAGNFNYVREKWEDDIVQLRLMQFLSDVRPDVVLIFADLQSPSSIQWQYFYSALIQAIHKIAQPESVVRIPSQFKVARWEVDKVLVESTVESGLPLPVDEPHPILGVSYRTVASNAATFYESLRYQHQQWTTHRKSLYRFPLEPPVPPQHDVLFDIRGSIPSRFQWIEGALHTIAHSILRDVDSSRMTNQVKETILRGIVTVIDSVDYHMRFIDILDGRERKLLIQWKLALEQLRATLLGVDVQVTLSETILTRRQLTYLTIHSINGVLTEGYTEVYFPGTEHGWIVNESLEKRFPLEVNTEYRLISPPDVDYTYPHHLYGLDKPRVGSELIFFVIHHSPQREKNFAYRVSVPIEFAPRFSFEALTPIVAARPNEVVVVRMTNHSRDGVSDYVGVAEDFVYSQRVRFRLNRKGSTTVETLRLSWDDELSEGTYLVPVKIADDTIGFFAARKFEVEVQCPGTVGIVPSFENSPAKTALKRLGCPTISYDFSNIRTMHDEDLHTLILDFRLFTIWPEIAHSTQDLSKFVENGGHLIILAQDASAYHTLPLWQDLTLSPSSMYDEKSQVKMAHDHPIMVAPNVILDEDWNEWIVRRAYNKVTYQGPESNSVVKIGEDENPVILSTSRGRGVVTYVDLAMNVQLMNVHEGAFRLLANLISYQRGISRY